MSQCPGARTRQELRKVSLQRIFTARAVGLRTNRAPFNCEDSGANMLCYSMVNNGGCCQHARSIPAACANKQYTNLLLLEGVARRRRSCGRVLGCESGC